jgi:hypothetical protein
MDPDPIVEEVRRIRAEYAAKFNYDLRALCEDVRRRSEQAGIKPVSLPPRRPTPRPAVTKKKAG